MPAYQRRKVGMVGNGLLYVGLPRAWCRGNYVAKGDHVDVWFGSVLIVVPPGGRELAKKLLAAGGAL